MSKTPCPFNGLEERCLIRLTLTNGVTLTGYYTSAADQHFLHQFGTGLSLLGQITGPYVAADIRHLDLLKTRKEVQQEGRRSLLGDPVPGREPVTRDDYEYRLQTIARAIAAAEDWQREVQLRRQFADVAQRIHLSSGKRAWIIAEAKWRQRSNEQPTLRDLSGHEMTSPSLFARPRPQDFDPDPTKRRQRVPLPVSVQIEPFAPHNILSAFKSAGLKARITRIGDPAYDAAEIQVAMPLKGRAHFIVTGQRDTSGQMQWKSTWDGNFSKAGTQRFHRSLQTDAYKTMMEILRTGRQHLQQNLFTTLM